MAEGRRRGRPSKLTEELASVIIGFIERGNYRTTAAAMAGVNDNTFKAWMLHKTEPYVSFQKRMLEAEAFAEASQLAKIIESDETADAKWYLARKFPDRWAETRRVDLSGRLDVGVKVDGSALSDPKAREALETLTDWLIDHGDTEPGSAGPDSDE